MFASLFRIIDWLIDLPLEFEQSFQEELHVWEEEKRMPYITSVERAGREKGLQQGLLKGVAVALALKFGKADKRLLAKVNAIQSVKELEDLLEAIPGCSNIQEIRDRLAEPAN